MLQPTSASHVLTALYAEAMQLHNRGQFAQAEQKFRLILQYDPRQAEAWHRLGIIAYQTAQYHLADKFIRQALQLAPNHAPCYVNLGNTLKALTRFSEAAACYRRAIALEPKLASAYNNLGTTLQALGEIDEAVTVLQQAIELNPEQEEILNNLANLYKEQGRLHDALGTYQHALSINRRYKEAYSNRLAALKLSLLHTPEDVYREHRGYGLIFQSIYERYQCHSNTPDPQRRLKIGYVSPDCHTALPAFMRPVLKAHNPQQFEVYCYYNNPQPRETETLLSNQQIRITSGLSDEQLLLQIQQDQIDILIDLAGHTGKNRLQVFIARPAPVQMTWLDYLNTTGLTQIDYRITDAITDPPGETERWHSETLLRLPGSQWCYEPAADAPEVAPLPMLHNDYLTFGSFNNTTKLTDATLALWARLLHELSNARLLAIGVHTGYAQARLRAAFGSAVERVKLLPRLSAREYRAAFAEVDIALDPFPFSGATTTLDALWQGVPVLTLPGKYSASRSAASLLTTLGLQEWIATNEEDYLHNAKRWSTAVSELVDLRAGLRDRMRRSRLLDATEFTRELEAIYRKAWQRWCAEVHDAPQLVEQEKIHTRAAADYCYIQSEKDIQQGELEAALAKLRRVLNYQPGWTSARLVYVSSALMWAKRNPQKVAQILAPMPPLDKTERKSVSVVICSIKPEQFARVTARYREVFTDYDLEIIGIHDAKSLCEGYNRGATQSRGDMLIFSHDDIDMVNGDFASRLLTHLARYDVVGVAGTSKLIDGDHSLAGYPYVHGQVIHEVEKQMIYLCADFSSPVAERAQAFDGLFFAVRREVWESLKFDEQTFDGFHLYDVDFTYRAYLAGFRLAIPLDLLMIHYSTGKYDRVWHRYNQRFREKFKDQLRGEPGPNPAINVKLKSLQEIDQLRAALLHFRYGASPHVG